MRVIITGTDMGLFDYFTYLGQKTTQRVTQSPTTSTGVPYVSSSQPPPQQVQAPRPPSSQPSLQESEIFNPTERMATYPAYTVAKGASDWWNQNIAMPYEKQVSVLQGKGLGWEILGGVSTGLVRSPALMTEFIGMVPAGTERLMRETVRSPSVLPSYASAGVMLQYGSIKEGLTSRPYQFVGEQVGLSLLTYGMGEAYGRLPYRVAIDSAAIGERTMTSIGVMKTRGAISIFWPGVGVVQEGVGLKGLLSTRGVLGTKRFTIPETGFKPVTPLEARIASRMMGVEGAKITLAQQIRMGTQGAGLSLRELTPVTREIVRSHQIPGEAAVTKGIMKVMKSEKAQLYGSPIQRGIGMERGQVGLGRVPRDIDVHVADVSRFNQKMMTEINTRAGAEITGIVGDQVVVKATGKTLFDTHAVESISADLLKRIGEEGYIAYGMKSERMAKTMEGIKAITGSEQASRKFSGSMELITPKARTMIAGESGTTITGKIGPVKAGRIKDIGDVYLMERMNIDSISRSINPLKRARAKPTGVALERWLDMWGKDVAGQARIRAAGRAGKVPLYDFSTSAARRASPIRAASMVSVLRAASPSLSRSPSPSVISSPSPSPSISPSISRSISRISGPSISRLTSLPSGGRRSPSMSPPRSPSYRIPSYSPPKSPIFSPPYSPGRGSPPRSPTYSPPRSPPRSPPYSPGRGLPMRVPPIVPPTSFPVPLRFPKSRDILWNQEKKKHPWAVKAKVKAMDWKITNPVPRLKGFAFKMPKVKK